MAGDPASATIWPDADVYTAPLGTAIPLDASTAFAAAWELVGLLDGDEGFTQSRDEDVSDHYAWGGILVRTSRRNFKLTIGFTALEDNDVVRDLVWPGSAAGQLVVPTPARILIAFETREGAAVRRLISAYQAEVAVDGDITDQEAELTNYPLVATIFPDATGVLLTEQTTP